MSRLLLSVTLGLLLAMPATAAIYRYTDEHGNTVFTSRPPQDAGSEEVQLKSPNLIPPPPEIHPLRTRPEPQEQERGYDMIRIGNVPEIVRSEQLQVSVSLQPALRKGHRLSLKFDGQPVGEPGTSTRISVSGIERGPHTLQAVVEDDEGVVASSEVVEFNRLQPGVNRPAR